MAEYYIDGTIVSATGTGSGTVGDPWGKTDDLLQYALDQIVAGGGKDTTGDTIYVTGDLNQTASVDFTGYNPQQTTPLAIRPIEVDLINYDLGGTPFINNTTTRALLIFHVRFFNFGGNTGAYPVRSDHFSGFFQCVFDGVGSTGTYGFTYFGPYSTVIGCKFINENRAVGLVSYTSTGGFFAYNYVEIDNTAQYAMYTYYTTFAHNIVRVKNGRNTGCFLPIATGRYFNNTFYGENNTGSAIFVSSAYEDQNIFNNYFEGLYRPLNISTNHNANVSYLVGNRAYNNTTNTVPSDSTTIVYDFDNDFAMTESGLIDPANGDYRPKSSLINAGVNMFAWSQAQEYTVSPTVGSILPTFESPHTRPIFPRVS